MEQIKLISETGETFCVSDLRQFARDNNLDPSALIKVSKRQRKSHKGFRLDESATNETQNVAETKSVSICPQEFNNLKIRVAELEAKLNKFLNPPATKKFSNFKYTDIKNMSDLV